MIWKKHLTDILIPIDPHFHQYIFIDFLLSPSYFPYKLKISQREADLLSELTRADNFAESGENDIFFPFCQKNQEDLGGDLIIFIFI